VTVRSHSNPPTTAVTEDYDILESEFHVRLQTQSTPAKAALSTEDPFSLLMNPKVIGGTVLLTLLLMAITGIFN
jgi:hypothetical protein